MCQLTKIKIIGKRKHTNSSLLSLKKLLKMKKVVKFTKLMYLKKKEKDYPQTILRTKTRLLYIPTRTNQRLMASPTKKYSRGIIRAILMVHITA